MDGKTDTIRRRVEATFPGPWLVSVGSNDGIVRGPGEYIMADCRGHEANAEFIAHARTDVPALLDALAATVAERDALRHKVTQLRETLYECGRHVGTCYADTHPERPCTCGLDAALAVPPVEETK